MPTKTYRFHTRTIRQAALEMREQKEICRLLFLQQFFPFSLSLSSNH